MRKQPVRFYFWEHSTNAEFSTQTLADLARSSAVIFPEGLSSSPARARQLEESLNTASANGTASLAARSMPWLSASYREELEFLLRQTAGTRPRYVVERTLPPTFESNAMYAESNEAYFFPSLDLAIALKEEYLLSSQPYQKHREQGVAKQLVEIPDATLVIFGELHRGLAAKLAASGRPTEQHFPFPDYPLSFCYRMTLAFRKTSRVDPELYLRDITEQLLTSAFRQSSPFSMRGIKLVAHRYAELLTLDQLNSLRNYLTFCHRFAHSLSLVDMFESYFRREHLPGIHDMHATIIDRERTKP